MASQDLCNCPIGSINSIPATDCTETIGVIRKMAISREKKFQAKTPPATLNKLKDLAEWATTLDATDDTKTVITDFIENVDIAPGDFNTETVSQFDVINGKKPAKVTGVMIGASADTIDAMLNIACEKKLFVYFINDLGQIIHTYDTDGTTPSGFRIMPGSFGVQDKSVNGNSSDSEKNIIQFEIERGWSANAVITTPSFDALSDLVNTVS